MRAEDAPLLAGHPSLSAPCCSWSDYNLIPISSSSSPVCERRGGGGDTDALEAVSDGTGGGGGGGCYYPLLTVWTPRGGRWFRAARAHHTIYDISHPRLVPVVFGPFVRVALPQCCGRIIIGPEGRRAGRRAAAGTTSLTIRMPEVLLDGDMQSSHVGLVQTPGCLCASLQCLGGPLKLETDASWSLAVNHMPLKACASLRRRHLPIEATMTRDGSWPFMFRYPRLGRRMYTVGGFGV